jgi:hypothetical protein
MSDVIILIKRFWHFHLKQKSKMFKVNSKVSNQQ